MHVTLYKKYAFCTVLSSWDLQDGSHFTMMPFCTTLQCLVCPGANRRKRKGIISKWTIWWQTGKRDKLKRVKSTVITSMAEAPGKWTLPSPRPLTTKKPRHSWLCHCFGSARSSESLPKQYMSLPIKQQRFTTETALGEVVKEVQYAYTKVTTQFCLLFCSLLVLFYVFETFTIVVFFFFFWYVVGMPVDTNGLARSSLQPY